MSARARWRPILGVLGVGLTAALLFAACGGGGDQTFVPPKTGPAIYRTYCATCHGKQGQGFVGPNLADMATKYPNVADEISIVTNGKGQMPSWAGRLTAQQIATVVDFTRTEFTTEVIGPTVP